MASQVDPLWYKDAIVYQLHVRAFQDGNGDGIGDFAGLRERLGYVRDLGATAIWLLPFYPSPLRDDGYDIADYYSVHPSYGTLDDFREFLDEAHRLGLRVITELVLNHTSDQHPWFQRARRAPAGSTERDFYVWSDDTRKYGEARIIFGDYESSNWEWDPLAGGHYWHRFYKHQPDLNYDNPAVLDAMLGVFDFWLEMGVDGLRLDAVPYLVEREGTSCENLPETHAVLRRVRAHIDERYAGRMLLAEANQWPEDAAEYFGSGDECHACFHFPLMPRLYMAVEREDRFPIEDILEQMPEIPDNCQWMTFLRNHDELTLEMVTDEDRDSMYRTYAADPRARLNLGIRRRLAPLMAGDRRKVELLNVLLVSLPGTPIVYYGDEIGMGDNIHLGDRDGVRTPMQWNGDRNAGFSRANPQRLYLPVNLDGAFHYNTVNVEAQESASSSLLSWMRRLIALVRKRHLVFGRGDVKFLHPDNPRVLAFLRTHGDEVALVVVNLSRFSQFVELDLSRFQGAVPVELFGRTRFPPIGEWPYLLTLGPYASLLFSLESRAANTDEAGRERPVARLNVSDSSERMLEGRAREALEHALPDFVNRQPWYPSGRRAVRNASIQESFELDGGADGPMQLLVVYAESSEIRPQEFCVPLALAEDRQARPIPLEHPECVIAVSRETEEEGGRLLYDAAFETRFAGSLLRVLAAEEPVLARWSAARIRPTGRGELFGEIADRLAKGPALHRMREDPAADVRLRESFHVGEDLALVVFRRLEPGRHPDLEVGRYLESRGHDHLAPRIRGALEIARPGSPPTTLAVLRDALPGEGTARDVAELAYLQFLERVLAHETPPTATCPRETFPTRPSDEEVPLDVRSHIGPFLAELEALAVRVAEFHAALVTAPAHDELAPQPFTRFYCRELYQSARTVTRRAFDELRRRQRSVPLEETAHAVLEGEPRLLDWYRRATPPTLEGLRIRCHGDLRLVRLAFTGNDFRFADFAGDPAHTYGENRIKRSPLWDVATLLVSLHGVAQRPLHGSAPEIGAGAASRARLSEAADFWYLWATNAFLRSYLREPSLAAALPTGEKERRRLLRLFTMQTAISDLDRGLARSDGDLAASLAVVAWHLGAILSSPGPEGTETTIEGVSR